MNWQNNDAHSPASGPPAVIPRFRDERFDTEVGPGAPLAIPASGTGGGRPTVTICGSMRFFPLMIDVAAELTSKGAIVLMPYKVVPPGEQSGPAKAALDQLHRDKIDQSASVVVVTDPTGYYGDSTRGEIAHAIRTGKPVTLCQRTVDTSGIGQELAADEDRTILLPEFTPEAASKADALRIAAIEGAEGGYACGHDAVYLLPDELLAELPDPLAWALSGVELQPPEGPWPEWARTTHPVNWPYLIRTHPEEMTWNYAMLENNFGAAPAAIADAYQLLATNGARPYLEVCLWVDPDGRIAVEPLALNARTLVEVGLLDQVDDILVAGGRPRELLRDEEEAFWSLIAA
ncbi:hypothetical protein [Nocardia jinanensis]|uniref:Uncharacterized protein n=1 Tax=Nocardia jinanensis TaxID=382504 RepID=A0A917W0G1_9NOCA|nr:hypothetical protein [Nocardia jinanensis]GGL46967.1 hypothetical protein GCM10011588_72330 [Nocardia jinanensis]